MVVEFLIIVSYACFIVESELSEYLKKELAGFYRYDPLMFEKFVAKLQGEGVYEPCDLKNLEETEIEKLGLPTAQKKKFQDIIVKQKGSDDFMKNAKNVVALAINNSSNPKHKTKVTMGEKASLNISVGDKGDVKRKGSNIATASIGNVDVDFHGEAKATIGDTATTEPEPEAGEARGEDLSNGRQSERKRKLDREEGKTQAEAKSDGIKKEKLPEKK